MLGSEEPKQVFLCLPKVPTEEPNEERTQISPIASPMKRCRVKSDDDNSTFETPPRKKNLVEKEEKEEVLTIPAAGVTAN